MCIACVFSTCNTPVLNTFFLTFLQLNRGLSGIAFGINPALKAHRFLVSTSFVARGQVFRSWWFGQMPTVWTLGKPSKNRDPASSQPYKYDHWYANAVFVYLIDLSIYLPNLSLSIYPSIRPSIHPSHICCFGFIPLSIYIIKYMHIK